MALSLIKAALVKAEGKWWFVFTADEKRFEELKRLVTSGKEIKVEELKQYGSVALWIDCEIKKDLCERKYKDPRLSFSIASTEFRMILMNLSKT